VTEYSLASALSGMLNVIITVSGMFLLRSEIEVLERIYQLESIHVSEMFTFSMLLPSVLETLNEVVLVPPAVIVTLVGNSFIRK